MAEKLTWEQYAAKFPQPYDIDQYSGRPISEYPSNYDEMRKANMKWQADFYLKYGGEAGPVQLLNPFIMGGWYYGLRGNEWIPSPNPAPETDWAAEAAAGRPVIGPAAAPGSAPAADLAVKVNPERPAAAPAAAPKKETTIELQIEPDTGSPAPETDWAAEAEVYTGAPANPAPKKLSLFQRIKRWFAGW